MGPNISTSSGFGGKVGVGATEAIEERLAVLAQRPGVLFALVSCFLLLVNAAALTTPPYWDAILGVFNQAVWLAKHNFDFVRLWTTEPGWYEGGSRLNSPSVVPILLAVLYKLVRPQAVFVIAHVVTLLLASMTFVLFFLILAKHVGPLVALLWCVAATCEPVWSGRCAEIYRDMPVAACSAVALYYVHSGRLRRACVWIVVSFLVKETAMLVALALLVWMPVRHVLRRLWLADGKGRLTVSRSGYMLLAAPLLGVLAFGLVRVFRWGKFESIPHIVSFFPRYFYYFFPSLGFELVVITLVAVAVLATRRGRNGARRHRDRLFFSLFLLILVYGFWAAFALFRYPLPRYASFVVFPMAALLALNLPKTLSVALASTLIVWGSLNQYGRFLPPIVAHRLRSGESLERSREYLVDLEANIKICRTLEQEFFDTPIVAKWPYAQMLTMPEMGYVRKGLPNVYAVGIKPRYAAAKLYDPREAGRETLYIYSPSAFDFWALFGPSLHPETGDILVLADESLPGKVLIYRKGPNARRPTSAGPGNSSGPDP